MRLLLLLCRRVEEVDGESLTRRGSDEGVSVACANASGASRVNVLVTEVGFGRRRTDTMSSGVNI